MKISTKSSSTSREENFKTSVRICESSTLIWKSFDKLESLDFEELKVNQEILGSVITSLMYNQFTRGISTFEKVQLGRFTVVAYSITF